MRKACLRCDGISESLAVFAPTFLILYATCLLYSVAGVQVLLDMWAMKNEASVTHVEETAVSEQDGVFFCMFVYIYLSFRI